MRPCFPLVALLCLIGPVGCGMMTRPGPAETPESFARYVASARSAAAWKLLPRRWRTDITSLIQASPQHLDADVYDKGFTILTKAKRLLQSRKEFLLGSRWFRAPHVDHGTLGRDLDSILVIVDALASSDARRLDRLRRIDVERFLSRTIDPVLREMMRLSKDRAGEFPEWLEAARTLEARNVKQTRYTATIAVTLRGEISEAEMVRVDTRWVPADLARDWDGMIAAARRNLEARGIPGNKMLAMQFLAAVEATLDVLSAARTQEEFDAAVGQLMAFETRVLPW